MAQQNYIANNLYKPKVVPKDKSSEQYEYERNAKELSFEPYFFTKPESMNNKQAAKVIKRATIAPKTKPLFSVSKATPRRTAAITGNTIKPMIGGSNSPTSKKSARAKLYHAEVRSSRNYQRTIEPATGGLARSAESSAEFRGNDQAETGGLRQHYQ